MAESHKHYVEWKKPDIRIYFYCSVHIRLTTGKWLYSIRIMVSYSWSLVTGRSTMKKWKGLKKRSEDRALWMAEQEDISVPWHAHHKVEEGLHNRVVGMTHLVDIRQHPPPQQFLWARERSGPGYDGGYVWLSTRSVCPSRLTWLHLLLSAQSASSRGGTEPLT